MDAECLLKDESISNKFYMDLCDTDKDCPAEEFNYAEDDQTLCKNVDLTKKILPGMPAA